MTAFSKYHGAGNDFVLIDGRLMPRHPEEAEIARICHRHFGVGADGLMILRPGSDTVDYHMLYYNSDGRPSSMCGNGARCAFVFAHRIGLCQDTARFVAYDGEHTARFVGDGLVEISMQDVQMIRHKEEGRYELNTGSPHLVTFVPDLVGIDAFGQGRTLRNAPEYRDEGINVNFVSVDPDRALRIRTYERGVEDLTLACGTGVTAAAIAYAVEQALPTGPVAVRADGGTLSVNFEQHEGVFRNVFLTGPVAHVFDGQMP